MSHSVNTPDIFRWKRFTKRGIPSKSKVQLTDGDINQWMKRVEMASEFAISEVFSPQKTHTGKTRRVVPLQNAEQLQDHDDAYSEAQAVLSDWMNRKLLHELEMDEEGEELICSNEMQTPELIALNQSANLNYKNFDDMYSHLAQEDESFVVHNFLQDLMETEVLDSGISEDLCLDLEKEKKRGRDPGVTMELRHRQVKENRVRREAAQERQRREAEVRREAREQELLQQEVIRLRNNVMPPAGNILLACLSKQGEGEAGGTALQSAACNVPDWLWRTETAVLQGAAVAIEIIAVIIISLLCVCVFQCMQKHFSGWYSVVLEKRVRLGKAAALCDWRRQLRVWRAWRALVWAKRMEREAERTEEELRMETRRCQVAVESDWRRLMRRCLNDWRLWCRMEKERRELLSQQEETKRKMADLISAAASGKLAAESCTEPPITALHNYNLSLQGPVQRASLAHTTSTLTDRKAAPPTQAWQVTRRHAALSPEDLHQARHGPHLNAVPRCWSAEVRGGRFEHRHAVQKQTIAEQRHLLREQQELISHLQETQNFLELRQEAERSAEAAAALSPVHVKHAASRSGTQANAKGRDLKCILWKWDDCVCVQRELEKQKRAETEQQLLKRAVEHYHRSLLLHRGLAPWKRLVAGSQTRMQKAVDHYQWGLQRRCLLSWLQVAGEALADKEAHSDQLYKHILLRRAVWAWKRMKRQQTLLGEQAEHFFRARVQRKAFNALLDHATHERLVAWENTQQAAEHSLLRRCFGGWRHLPMVLREEREREARRQRLRRMVAEVLPDFRSSRVDGLWSSAPRL
uniref:Coiled-coil domain containing 191 n=1 Tax=Electrophorus electricus TaxID=8005 RepID=A0A4W4GZJ2_ELEEL